MKLIWATRGRTWGFRFLRNGGFEDPLPEYDKVFSELADEPEVFCRVGKKVALRFQDPLQRKDAAGRVISHDFVVYTPLADNIVSVEKGKQQIWPLVEDQFKQDWDKPKPPPAK